MYESRLLISNTLKAYFFSLYYIGMNIVSYILFIQNSSQFLWHNDRYFILMNVIFGLQSLTSQNIPKKTHFQGRIYLLRACKTNFQKEMDAYITTTFFAIWGIFFVVIAYCSELPHLSEGDFPPIKLKVF